MSVINQMRTIHKHKNHFDKIMIKENVLNREFNGKKQLYQHFGFKNEKEVPEEYEIGREYIREKGKKQRVYSLVKIE